MTCSPSQTARRSGACSERERNRTQLLLLLERAGMPRPLDASGPAQADASLATALMDAFRRTRDAEVFEALIDWAGPQLRARVQLRLRTLGALLDPGEILQDTIVNIYRYPDRFQASRPGAFAAWSSTIVDNAIRRQLRLGRRDRGVALRDPEVMQEQADATVSDPSVEAESHEQCRRTAAAFGTLLTAYLTAFQQLSERERFVLQMVEVRHMRYAELAQLIGIRPEALKMVVFRARRRLHDRMVRMFAPLAGDRDATAAAMAEWVAHAG